MLLNSTQKRSLPLAISLAEEITDVVQHYQNRSVTAYDLEKLEELQKTLWFAYNAAQLAAQPSVRKN